MAKTISIIVLSFIFAFTLYRSIHFAQTSPTGDFAVFYCAGRIVLDPSLSKNTVYDLEKLKTMFQRYNIKRHNASYLYSIAAAYLFSPFALIPYETAKVVFNVFNVLIYMCSVAIILCISGTTGIRFVVFLSLSFAWVPFIYNQYWLQSNTIVLFFITLGTLLAVRNRPLLSGLFFGASALIKIFPFAIAMVLGLKNWRIFAVCTAVFIASFIIPGSSDWFSAIRHTHHINYTAIYRHISSYGIGWSFFYAMFIALTTALVAYQARFLAYPMLASLAIPSALLISPVVGSYYLVLLIFSYVYSLAIANAHNKALKAIIFLSFCLINYTVLIYDSFTVGLLSLWGVLAWWMNHQVIPQVHEK